MWRAKIRGGYDLYSPEWRENIVEANILFNSMGYSLEAQAGILGNIQAESALNPWRWQDDSVSLTSRSKGYGLLQFTPAFEYVLDIDLPNHAPSLSVTEATPGASPNDAICQLNVLNNDNLAKWNSTCWRIYWDKTEYAALWQKAQNILNTFGNGSNITINQFKTINNVDDAVFAFLACYEGPQDPNYSTRVTYANAIYELLGGTPVRPLDIVIIKKIIDNHKII